MTLERKYTIIDLGDVQTSDFEMNAQFQQSMPSGVRHVASMEACSISISWVKTEFWGEKKQKKYTVCNFIQSMTVAGAKVAVSVDKNRKKAKQILKIELLLELNLRWAKKKKTCKLFLKR
jgi:hypothetical protein